MNRAFRLYLIEIRSLYNRLRHDLSRELVVAICSLVLLGLFGYVFNDLLNREVARISPASRDTLGQVFSALLCCGLAITWGHGSRSLAQNQHPIQLWLRRTGESPTIIKRFAVFAIGGRCAVVFGLFWWVSARWLTSWPLASAALLQVAALLLGTVWMRSAPLKQLRDTSKKPLSDRLGERKQTVLVQWRWRQMLARNRTVRVSLILAVLFWLLAGSALIQEEAPLTILLASFCGGLVMAFGIFAQLTEDMKAAWAERSMGISHDDIVNCYRRLALRFVPLPLVVLVLSAVIAATMDLQNLLIAGQFALAGATPLFLAAGLMFQIDVHRPFLQLLTLGMIGIFMATAIYAHIAAVLLIPLFNYYAFQFQAGRYFRA